MQIKSDRKNQIRNYNFIPWWKKPIDILVSIFALLLFSPIMIFIAIAIKLTDKGPIFYAQERVGYRGKRFKILKFRTMYADAEKKLQEILEKDPKAKEEWEKFFKLKNDPRITRIGKFLRKTSLDELPQFLNVLKGDMSIVGPRPVTEEELKKFYKEKAELYKLVRPGVTGYWQVEGRSDVENYEKRVKMDEWYIKNQSLLLDIKIICKTIKIMLTGKGAY